MKKLILLLFITTLCHAQYGVFNISPDSTSRNHNPQQIQLTNGDVVICWSTYDTVYMRFWPKDMETPGKIVAFQSNNMNIPEQIFAKSLPNGKFMLCNSYVSQVLYRQIFTFDGQAINDEKAVLASPLDMHILDVIVLTTGDFLIYGIKSEKLYGHLFSLDGQPVGEAFQMYSNDAHSKKNPACVALADGGFAACWQVAGTDGDGWGINAQVFNSAGEKTGETFQVNTYTRKDQLEPIMCALPNGRFVIAWESMEQDLDSFGIFAQVFNADGSQHGYEFQVNYEYDDWQKDPYILPLTNNTFFICWESWHQDGPRAMGLFSQLFTADGVRIGEEIQVNQSTIAEQQYPRMSELPGYGFVVIWQSKHDGCGYYGQLFNYDADKVGQEFTVFSDCVWSSNRHVLGLQNGDFMISWPANSYAVEEGYYIGDIQAWRSPPRPTVQPMHSFDLLSPKSDVSHHKTFMPLSWEKANINELIYDYEVIYEVYCDTLPDFSTATVEKNVRTTQHTLYFLRPGRTYFWKVAAVDVNGNRQWSSTTNAFFVEYTATPVSAKEHSFPMAFTFSQNYPNPFNQSTFIDFSLPQPGNIRLSVFDITGRLVRVLSDQYHERGKFQIKWDGRDDNAQNASSGLYFCRIEYWSSNDDRQIHVRKMNLIR